MVYNNTPTKKNKEKRERLSNKEKKLSLLMLDLKDDKLQD